VHILNLQGVTSPLCNPPIRTNSYHAYTLYITMYRLSIDVRLSLNTYYIHRSPLAPPAGCSHTAVYLLWINIWYYSRIHTIPYSRILLTNLCIVGDIVMTLDYNNDRRCPTTTANTNCVCIKLMYWHDMHSSVNHIWQAYTIPTLYIVPKTILVF